MQYSAPTDPSEGNSNMARRPRCPGRPRGRRGDLPETVEPDEPVVNTPVVKSEWDKTGRNDPCPCGSGKKFKQCHGA